MVRDYHAPRDGQKLGILRNADQPLRPQHVPALSASMLGASFEGLSAACLVEFDMRALVAGRKSSHQGQAMLAALQRYSFS